MPERKIFVQVGRDERVRPLTMSLSPETRATKYKSVSERSVLELLEYKHAVPSSKWKRIGAGGMTVLKRMISDKNSPFRTKAITALVLSENKEHVQTLRKIVADRKENDLVRSVAVISLGMSRDPGAVAVLIKFINDKSDFVRAKVVEAIGRIGQRDSYEVLFRATKDKSPLVSSNARNALRLIEYRFGLGPSKLKTGD